jgi:hypothetical protein
MKSADSKNCEGVFSFTYMSQQEMTAVITSVMWSLSHTFIPQTIPKTNQTWKSKFCNNFGLLQKTNTSSAIALKKVSKLAQTLKCSSLNISFAIALKKVSKLAQTLKCSSLNVSFAIALKKVSK